MSAAPPSSASLPKYKKRKAVLYQDRVIYEWEQDLDEVNIFITAPPNLTAAQIECSITHKHIRLGIKGNPPYLDVTETDTEREQMIEEDIGGLVVEKESFWTLEDGIIHLQLQKALIGSTWLCATTGHPSATSQHTETDVDHPSTGHTLTAYEQQQEHKQMLLQRFSMEHPGFDFSQATVNGGVPDAREFMGGITQQR